MTSLELYLELRDPHSVNFMAENLVVERHRPNFPTAQDQMTAGICRCVSVPAYHLRSVIRALLPGMLTQESDNVGYTRPHESPSITPKPNL